MFVFGGIAFSLLGFVNRLEHIHFESKKRRDTADGRILHHLGCKKNLVTHEIKKVPISWCRISSINSMNLRFAENGWKNIFSVSWWFSQQALNAAETKKHLERTPSGGGFRLWTETWGPSKPKKSVRSPSVKSRGIHIWQGWGFALSSPSPASTSQTNPLEKTFHCKTFSKGDVYRPPPKRDMNLASLLWFREDRIHPVTGETWDTFILHSCKKKGVESWSQKLVY